MASVPQYIRNVNVYVDGRGYAGQFNEIQLPTVTLNTEEYRGGGMDAPVEIDMGMEALTAQLTTNNYDPALFGTLGLTQNEIVPITARAAVDDAGTIIPVVAKMRGSWKEVDMGSWQPGEKGSNTFSMALRYYQLQVDGSTVYEIDVVNMKRIVNGTDQMAAVRSAIGL